MAAIDVPLGGDKLNVGIESTFGTAASVAFARHVSGSAKPKISQTEIEMEGASARLFQRFTSVQGLKSGDSGIAFTVHGKPALLLLDSAATPATPYLGTLLKAILGTEQSGAGSTVTAGSTTTSVNVTPGHGTARFYVGGAVFVEVSNVYYPCWVTATAANSITVWPALPGTPAAADDVINSYTYSASEANSQSLTIEHTQSVPAAASATVQRRLLGCTGSFSMEVSRDQLVTFGFDLKAADWQYGTLSIANSTVGTESMGTPIPVTQGECYLQAAATTTRTNYALLSLSIKPSPMMEQVKCVTGGVQGVAGVIRNGGRQSVEFTLRLRADVAQHTAWSAQTLYRLAAAFPSGSGLTKRMVSVLCNQCQIVGVPVESEEGGMLYYDITLKPVLDSALVVDTAGGAPYSISLT